MKKLILICGLLASTFSFGAKWVYVTTSEKGNIFYLDTSQYNYDGKKQSVDVWVKVDSKTGINTKLAEHLNTEQNERTYTVTKVLNRYSCSNKNYTMLAGVTYDEEGAVLSSAQKPNNEEFSIIFPDSVDEVMWKVVCSKKGKGFNFPKYEPEFVDLEKLGYKAP